MNNYKEWCEKAERFGATIEGGINWTWAHNFLTKEIAEEFERTPGMETRGVYHNQDGTFSVRFR